MGNLKQSPYIGFVLKLNLLLLTLAFISPALASYNPVSITNGSTTVNNIKNINFNGNLSLSNLNNGEVQLDFSSSSDTLDGLDSTQFLRSDTSDNYTSGTLTLDAGTTFDINSTAVSVADDNITFDAASTTFTQSSGAFTLSPAAGSNLNVSLSGTGDLVVSTNDLVVDTSSSYVGIGVTTPDAALEVGDGTAGSIDGADDVLIADDLEVDGDIYTTKLIASANVNGTIANFTNVLASASVNGATANFTKVLATGSINGATANFTTGNITTINSTTVSATAFNGTTFNGGTIDGDFTNGSVIFSNLAGELTQNNDNFFWNNNLTRLGISTNTPGSSLDVNGQITIRGGSPSNGYLLRSDGNGLSYWTDPSAIAIGNANTLDGLDSTQFLRSDVSDNFTSGTLTLDAGTTFDINSTAVSIADDNITLDGASTTFTQSSGAITLAPAAGSNLNVSLSGAGDFAISTNDLVVDTSSSYVGIGVTTPDAALEVGDGTAGSIDGADDVLIADDLEVDGDIYTTKLIASANANGTTANFTTGNITTINSTTVNATAFNGTTFNGGTIDGDFTNGSIIFSNLAGELTQNNDNFFWNNNLTRLGISTNTPGSSLDVNGQITIRGGSPSNGYLLRSDGNGLSYWTDPSAIAIGNANTLDGLDSTQFLRSDASDNFTSGTLTLDAGTTFDINSTAVSIADDNITLDGASTTFTQSSGAVTLAPAAGSNLNVSLSGAGDFVVSTDDLYVDTSTGSVGINDTSPDAMLDIEANSGSLPGLIITADANHTVNLTEWQNGSGTFHAHITNGGEFSNNGHIIGSEKYGDGAYIDSLYSTALGYRAKASGTQTVAVGRDAFANGTYAVAIGSQAGTLGVGAGQSSVRVGSRGRAQAYSVVIGDAANGSHFDTVVIGAEAKSTAANQLVIGAINREIYNAYIGGGVVHTSPSNITYHATGGSGTDISGGSFVIAGGRPTGSGTGGSIVFETANGGASSSTLTDLHERMKIDGETGYVGINTSSPTTNLDIDGQIKVRGGSPSNGYLLRSDGNGLGYWTDPSALAIGNADTLDGLEASQLLRSDSSDNFTSGTLTLDAGTTFDINSTAVSIADDNITLDGASTTFTQSSGAITLAPAAGSNLNVSLSGTGDLVVSTNDLVVDTSSSYVGIGVTTPDAALEVGDGTAGSIDGTDDVLIADDLEVDGDTYTTKLIASANVNGTTANFTTGNITTVNATTVVATTFNGGTLDGDFTNGSVIFANLAGELTQNNDNFFWNNNLTRLGISTNTPGSSLDVNGQITIRGGSPSNGYLLTTDGNGLGSWISPSSISSSNADTLDGLQSTQFLRSDSSDNFTSGTLTLDAGTTFDINSTAVSIADDNITLDGASTTFTQSSGAITLAPAAGSNLNVSLSGTGDLVVSTNDLVVDTSSSYVGIGVTTPDAALEVGDGTAGSIDGTDDVLIADDLEVDGDTYTTKLIASANVNGTTANFTTGNITTVNATTVAATTFNGGTLDGDFTNGSVIFANLAGELTQNNDNFFWNNNLTRLGISTNTPGSSLDVNGQITIRGGSPSNGYVLTSDGNGLASWQAASGGGGSTSPAGSAGAIQYNNGSGFAADDSNLFWDAANGRLGIGTNTPGGRINIGSAAAGVIANGLTFGDGDSGIYENVDDRAYFNFTEGIYIPLGSSRSVHITNAAGNIGMSLGTSGYYATITAFDHDAIRLYSRLSNPSWGDEAFLFHQDNTTPSGMNHVTFKDATRTHMIIDANGYMGVGRSTAEMQLDVNGDMQVRGTMVYESENDVGSVSTTATIDWTNTNKQKVTLTGNTTLSFTAPPGVANLLLKVVQDGTGGRTITWPGTVKWPGGTAPTLSTSASAIDIVSCYYDETNYFCIGSLDFQ